MSLPSLVALPPSLLPFVSRAEESFLAAAGSLSDAIAARCRAWLVEQRELAILGGTRKRRAA